MEYISKLVKRITIFQKNTKAMSKLTKPQSMKLGKNQNTKSEKSR